MTRDEAFTTLTVEHGMQELTATNLLLTALKGQSAWFGGSQSPYRLVHEIGVTREDGYQILADGFVIRVDLLDADALAQLDEHLIPEGAHWTLQGRDGMWVIRWHEATGTVQARRFDHGSPDGFSAEADSLPAARREVLRIAGLIDDGKTTED